MKHLKTFENYENEKEDMERKYSSDAWVQAQVDAGESLVPQVNVGDTIKLVNNSYMEGDTESTPIVQEVLPDGRILTDDQGHGVIAKYGLEGYEAWVVDEDDERGDTEEYKNPTV